jgi:hypothetical protein
MDERSLIFFVIYLRAEPVGLLDHGFDGRVDSLTRVQFHADLFANVEFSFAGFWFLLWHAGECMSNGYDVQQRHAVESGFRLNMQSVGTQWLTGPTAQSSHQVIGQRPN